MQRRTKTMTAVRSHSKRPNKGANLFGVISRIKVDMPSSGRTKFWRRRNGSNRYSFMSNSSQESLRAFADVEEEFLHAAEFGDIPGVKKLLLEHTDLNTDCIDALGRTALRLAVKNEHLEIVELLLDRSSQHHIYEAVLQAISAGHVQIAETILKHRRYLELCRERRKLGDTDGFFKTAMTAESQFSPDITPLILASQKNQYEIVQLLLLRGETIQKPHKYGCPCQECRNKMKFDQLRLAKYRLNAFKGLSSEAYLSLSSKDPILSAFELAQELRNLSNIEKHFKKEYRELADQLSEYVVKLLDRIRTQEELEMVLNKTGRSTAEKFEKLARFKLALSYHEKGFVSHPSCQQRLIKLFYHGTGKWDRMGWPMKILLATCVFLCYPFFMCIYLVSPQSKYIKLLKYPFVKFIGHTVSFCLFLVLIIASAIESSYGVALKRTFNTSYPNDFVKYTELINTTGVSWFGYDFPLRDDFPSVTTIMMGLWVIGFLFQECSQVYQNGVMDYVTSYYNIMDFFLISAYTASFTLKAFTLIKYYGALSYVQKTALYTNDDYSTFYWLNADRFYWNAFDPINLSEGLFAMANILSFARISYLLPYNESLGPLQISLGRMLSDIVKFMTLFSFVMVAFMVGLHNLFWYYSKHEKLEVEQRNITVPAEKSFGDVLATFRTVFWSLFGRGEPDVVKLGQYENNVTEDIGYIIYGAYNATSVTVLMNMLIAMMTRSFQMIQEDSDAEWKFSRSMLYMEYIGDSAVLPVPLNIIAAPREALSVLFGHCCSRSSEEEVPEKVVDDKVKDTDESGAMNPAYDSVTVELSETNGSFGGPSFGRQPLQSTTSITSEGRDEKLSYQKVMQRIIQRYIFDIQREAEVTEDDFEEIKQDISSFRYEILNQWKTKESMQTEMAGNLAYLKLHLDELRGQLLGHKAESKTVHDIKQSEKKNIKSLQEFDKHPVFDALPSKQDTKPLKPI